MCQSQGRKVFSQATMWFTFQQMSTESNHALHLGGVLQEVFHENLSRVVI